VKSRGFIPEGKGGEKGGKRRQGDKIGEGKEWGGGERGRGRIGR